MITTIIFYSFLITFFKIFILLDGKKNQCVDIKPKTPYPSVVYNEFMFLFLLFFYLSDSINSILMLQSVMRCCSMDKYCPHVSKALYNHFLFRNSVVGTNLIFSVYLFDINIHVCVCTCDVA